MVPGLRVQEFHIGSFKWDIVPLQEGVCQSFPCITIRSYVDVVAFHFVVLPKFCNQTVGCTPRSRPIQSMVVLLDDMIQHNSCWMLRHQTCLARDVLTTFRELDERPSGTQTCAGKSSMELFLGKSMGYCPLPRWIAGDGISTHPPKAHKEAQW